MARVTTVRDAIGRPVRKDSPFSLETHRRRGGDSILSSCTVVVISILAWGDAIEVPTMCDTRVSPSPINRRHERPMGNDSGQQGGPGNRQGGAGGGSHYDESDERRNTPSIFCRFFISHPRSTQKANAEKKQAVGCSDAPMHCLLRLSSSHRDILLLRLPDPTRFLRPLACGRRGGGGGGGGGGAGIFKCPYRPSRKKADFTSMNISFTLVYVFVAHTAS